MHKIKTLPVLLGVLPAMAAAPALAAAGHGPEIAGIPLDFFLLAGTLLGVALFHHRTMRVALIGLCVIAVYKLLFTGFVEGEGLPGLAAHFAAEWVLLANLLLLLLGFALLAKQFERSHVPIHLPDVLPDDWTGAFLLLCIVFVLSAFLDNIAAALIGGTMAIALFRGRVHIGYLAGLVAASNAGGSGSVVGDTTTTMMWIGGVSPLNVVHAYIPAAVALVVFGIPLAHIQQRFSPIVKDAKSAPPLDWTRVWIVLFILAMAILVNVTVNLKFPERADHFPFLGVTVWAAILLTALVRKPDWQLLPSSLKGSIFLLALVSCASMMPVDKLPPASWHSAFVLGFVSSVFDNIPLTELALKEGGFDWGMLAYAVGFGGSMVWFGSSAGVAVSNMFPEAKSVVLWVKHGWWVTLGYVLGFAALLAVWGWEPTATRGHPLEAVPAAAQMPPSFHSSS